MWSFDIPGHGVDRGTRIQAMDDNGLCRPISQPLVTAGYRNRQYPYRVEGRNPVDKPNQIADEAPSPADPVPGYRSDLEVHDTFAG